MRYDQIITEASFDLTMEVWVGSNRKGHIDFYSLILKNYFHLKVLNFLDLLYHIVYWHYPVFP